MQHLLRSFYPRLLLALFAIMLTAQLATAQNDSGFKYIEVTVVDPKGKPLADVEVNIDTDGSEFPMYTNSKGKVSFNVSSARHTQLKLHAKHEKFVANSTSWRGSEVIPKAIAIKMVKGTLVGGLVHDEKGQPIEGVKIYRQARVLRPGNIRELDSELLATTDNVGHWQEQVVEQLSKPLQLKLVHKDYQSHQSFGARATWEQLMSLDHVLVLEAGIVLQGQVTNPEGEPIAGALVYLGNDGLGGRTNRNTTDDQGNYRIGNVPAGTTVMTVAAKGWAPDLRIVQAETDMPAANFQLQPGKSITILITDPDGIPVSDVGVVADTWRGHRSLPEKLYHKNTNAEGVWSSDSMPADTIKFDAWKRGYMSSRNNNLVAGDEIHTIVLAWQLKISGKVVDAETGLPLGKFNLVQGIDWGNSNQPIHWQRYYSAQGADGKYEMKITESRAGHYIRIEADGYRPQVSRAIQNDEGEISIDFKMELGTGPSGIVTTPDGKPAEDVFIHVAIRSESLYVRNGSKEINNQQTPTETDEQGKYELPYLEGDVLLVYLHESGWAMLSNKQVEETADIQLLAWAKVEGKVQAGTQPLVDEEVTLSLNQPYVQNAPHVHWDYRVKSDADGKFVFDRVIEQTGTVALNVKFAATENSWQNAPSHIQQLKTIPGQTTKVQLGGSGRAIKGRLTVPENNEQQIVWSMGVVQLYEQTEHQATAGGFFQSLGRVLAEATAPQRAKPPQLTFRRRYASLIDTQGEFSISDVHPGHYRLTVQLNTAVLSTGQNYSSRTIGRLNQSITIPEPSDEGEQKPIDLGELMLKMNKN